jgi:hypothetical protein
MIAGSGAVAQWIERRFPKPCVGGSIPLSPIYPTNPLQKPKRPLQMQKNKHLF